MIAKVCIDKELPAEKEIEAMSYALAENLHNMPILPVGIQNNIQPYEMASVTGKKWQCGRQIKIYFMSGKQFVKDKVIKYAQQWEKYADIHLVFTDNQQESDIRIDFETGGSWSYIGTDALSIAKNEKTMNLGWLDEKTEEVEYSRVVLHEFGHMLGCIHEHQNPSSDIPWNVDAVYKYFGGPPNNWSRKDIDRNLFQKYNRDLTQFTSFDSRSIMVYSIDKALLSNPSFEVPWNPTLSDTDKRFIGQMYPSVPVNAYIKKLFMVKLNREPTLQEAENYFQVMSTQGRGVVVLNLELSFETRKNLCQEWYVKYIGRTARNNEEDGIARSLTNLQMSEESAISLLVGSDEFYLNAGSTEEKFIRSCFNILLKRPLSDIEAQGYLASLRAVGNRQSFALNVLESKEFRATMINNYYISYLKRQGTQAEINSWASTTNKLLGIKVGFLTSQEFFNAS